MKRICVIILLSALLARSAGAENLASQNAAILRDSLHRPQYQKTLELAKKIGIKTRLSDLTPVNPANLSNAAGIYIKMYSYASLEAGPDEESAYTLVDEPEPVEADWTAAKSFVDGHKDLIELAHDAAACPVSIIVHTANPLTNHPLLELGACRRAARFLAMESLLMAKEGKMDEAIHNIDQCFRIGDHAESDIALIGWLVGEAIDSTALRSLQHILEISNGNPDVARAVTESIAKHWKKRSLASALRKDAALDIDKIQQWRAGGPESVDITGDPNDRLHIKMPTPLWHAFMDANGTYLLRIYLRTIPIADSPYKSAYQPLSIIMAGVNNRKTSADATLAQIMSPDASKLLMTSTRTQAKAAVTAAAAAVFVYSAAHGAEPDSLSQIGAPLPLDPFNDRPLQYRRIPHGFVVYSVGETRKYRGGSFDSKAHKEQVFYWQKKVVKT